jgi:hypothetical protein
MLYNTQCTGPLGARSISFGGVDYHLLPDTLGRALDTADNFINISGTRYVNQSCVSGIRNFRSTSREWFCFESEMTLKVKRPRQWTVPKCAYACLTLLLYWIIQVFWIVAIVFKCINIGKK